MLGTKGTERCEETSKYNRNVKKDRIKGMAGNWVAKKKLRIGEVESETKNGKRKWKYRSEKESESKVWKKTMTKRKTKVNKENERLNREEDITW